MNIRHTAALLLLAALTVFAYAQETEPKQSTGSKSGKTEKKSGKVDKSTLRGHYLNITWWQEPVLDEGERLEMGVLVDKDFVSIPMRKMTMGIPFHYEGGPEVVIGRKAKVTETDAKGKTITTEKWIPYANLTIGENDTDLLVILIPLANKPAAAVRVFNISAEVFPYGSIQLINYSKAKVGCLLDGKAFYVAPGQTGRNPVPFTQEQVVSFRMGALDKTGTLRHLVNSPMLVEADVRRMYFFSESPGPDNEPIYRIDALVDHLGDHPKRPEPVDTQPEEKHSKSKPSAKKSSPKEETK